MFFVDLSLAIFGILNVAFGALSVLARIDPQEHNTHIFLAFLATGLLNLTGAFLRHRLGRDEDDFGFWFTISLLVASLLNLLTALRVLRAEWTRARRGVFVIEEGFVEKP
ncbi:hypothetical protein C8F01DRAFT_1371636 [Mycena amicta]|nr:hypothetical protein C8F01DRAFT_1371636 [Mycena amicta]